MHLSFQNTVIKRSKGCPNYEFEVVGVLESIGLGGLGLRKGVVRDFMGFRSR